MVKAPQLPLTWLCYLTLATKLYLCDLSGIASLLDLYQIMRPTSFECNIHVQCMHNLPLTCVSEFWNFLSCLMSVPSMTMPGDGGLRSNRRVGLIVVMADPAPFVTLRYT